MNIEHVSTWTASVYKVDMTMSPRGSACVYTVYVEKTNRPSIGNYFDKTRRSCFELRGYSL